MNLKRLQELRRKTTQADVIHLEGYALEVGRTCHDALLKMSDPVREMLTACAVCLAEERLRNNDRVTPPTNMKVERIARRLSSIELAREVFHKTGVKLDPDALRRFEESPQKRNEIKVDVVAAVEKYFERGWEWLAERVSVKPRTYSP